MQVGSDLLPRQILASAPHDTPFLLGIPQLALIQQLKIRGRLPVLHPAGHDLGGPLFDRERLGGQCPQRLTQKADQVLGLFAGGGVHDQPLPRGIEVGEEPLGAGKGPRQEVLKYLVAQPLLGTRRVC